MLPKISIIDGCKLQLPAIDTTMTGKISQKTIDMTPLAGQLVRIWIDEPGGYSVDPKGNHLWQVAEMAIPEITYQPVQVEDPESHELTEQSQAVPLDLNVCPVTLWPMPL